MSLKMQHVWLKMQPMWLEMQTDCPSVVKQDETARRRPETSLLDVAEDANYVV